MGSSYPCTPGLDSSSQRTMATKRATPQEPKIDVPATAVVSGFFLSGKLDHRF